MYLNDSLSRKAWSFSKFSAISTSLSFFNGGAATVVSAPMGLQINRRLSNNFYAFANVAVAPAYVDLRPSFITSRYDKMHPGSALAGLNTPAIFSAASLGVMYINDEKTFSISGSISVERSTLPAFQAYPTHPVAPIIPARQTGRQ